MPIHDHPKDKSLLKIKSWSNKWAQLLLFIYLAVSSPSSTQCYTLRQHRYTIITSGERQYQPGSLFKQRLKNVLHAIIADSNVNDFEDRESRPVRPPVVPFDDQSADDEEVLGGRDPGIVADFGYENEDYSPIIDSTFKTRDSSATDLKELIESNYLKEINANQNDNQEDNEKYYKNYHLSKDGRNSFQNLYVSIMRLFNPRKRHNSDLLPSNHLTVFESPDQVESKTEAFSLRLLLLLFLLALPVAFHLFPSSFSSQAVSYMNIESPGSLQQLQFSSALSSFSDEAIESLFELPEYSESGGVTFSDEEYPMPKYAVDIK